MPPQRWTSVEVHATTVERKRGRRLSVLTSPWAPWLLPFIALAALLALRASIVRIISEVEGGPAAVAQAGSQTSSELVAAATDAELTARTLRYDNKAHCSNTCFKASDGVCDEGRPANTTAKGDVVAAAKQRRGLLAVEGNPDIAELLCDLGTDCGDCGPWVGTVPKGWGDKGPVAWARETHNTSLFVRRTATPRPFLAAITHHQADPDVSAMLWHYGAMEGGVTRILHYTLNRRCVPGAGGKGRRRRIVVDVGANFGYYTVQAALYGCKVVAFEPVRKFRAALEWSVHAAGVAELVDVVPKALSDVEGQLQLVVPKDGAYWGLASINGVNVMPREVLETITVDATTLDRWEAWGPSDAKPKDVLLVKMDIEGWEANVLRGGRKMLGRHVENVLLEYSPGIYERRNMSDLAPQVALPTELLELSRAGYSLAHMPLFGFSAPWPPLVIKAEEPLPAFEEVTATALKHDLAALEYRRRMEVDPGGCPMPAELQKNFGVWSSCREWTYGVHPKGFRSAFGFNTNVWASRGSASARKHMRLQGTATLFTEGQDMRVWTSISRPGMAVGLINCTYIGAGHLQLFRCPCPPDAPAQCAVEQKLVMQLAAEGKMPFTGL